MRKGNNLRSVLGGFYVLLLIYLLLFAGFRDGTNTDVHLIPLETTSELIIDHSQQAVWYLFFSILGNLFIFIPIPFLFRLKWRGWRSLLLIIGVPAIFEFSQFLLQTGSADIDDVILNATGFGLGFWIRKKFDPTYSPPKSE